MNALTEKLSIDLSALHLTGEYYLDRSGTTQSIGVGDVVIAPTGSVHGVFNNGDEPLVFISIGSPSDAGSDRLSEFDRTSICL